VTQTVWRDEAARTRLEGWFDIFRARISVPTESRQLPSRHGPSHVLLAGPADGPPLLCLHAMRTSSAHLLSELGPLLQQFRVIAPDLPGQSVRGPQVRLPLNDDSNARWLLDILDGLSLGEVNVFGVSWGGFVARLLASSAPDRVSRLALLVPAGIANGSHWKGLTRMALPLLRYRLWRSERNLRRFLDPLLTTWDADWARYMGESLRDMPMDLRIPPLATDAELKRLTMPVLVLGAAEDISFPGEEVVARVRSQLPHADGELIAGCKHCPPTTDNFRAWLGSRLGDFFAARRDAEAVSRPSDLKKDDDPGVGLNAHAETIWLTHLDTACSNSIQVAVGFGVAVVDEHIDSDPYWFNDFSPLPCIFRLLTT
jgi:2-hydroxy-6-oxonona-2,4-dienedioate hydrolase